MDTRAALALLEVNFKGNRETAAEKKGQGENIE
jgi:hypothetical protein